MTRYWINTISHDHVLVGIGGGFTQANHGRATSLRRLGAGDLIAFYSPRTQMHDGESLQQFTAIVRVVDSEPYKAEITPDFRPWRRQVVVVPSTVAPIRPLIDDLDFIADKQHWGMPFRRGLFEISAEDFGRVAQAMQAAVGAAANAG